MRYKLRRPAWACGNYQGIREISTPPRRKGYAFQRKARLIFFRKWKVVYQEWNIHTYFGSCFGLSIMPIHGRFYPSPLIFTPYFCPYVAFGPCLRW